MSVKKGLEPINDKVYLNPKNDWDKIKNRLPEYKSILDEFDDCIYDVLEKTNILIINRLCEMLNINTEIVIDYPTELKSNARLIDLCRHYGATQYISGQGATSYLDIKTFNDNNIEVKFQIDINKKHVLEIL